MKGFESVIDFRGGSAPGPGYRIEANLKIEIDMWELDDGTKLLYFINNKSLVVFTHSWSVVRVAGMKLRLKGMKVTLGLSELRELPRTASRPWWLYGLS